MAKYYINKNSQGYPESGEHEVHREDRNCPKPPLWQNRYALGDFPNCKQAISRAKILFPEWKIDGCKHCNLECHNI